MDYRKVKDEALKLAWTERLKLAQDLLESLHHKEPKKPAVVDQTVPPSDLTPEDFGISGLGETVPNKERAESVTIPDVSGFPSPPSEPTRPSLQLDDGGSVAQSFQKLREALEDRLEAEN